MPKFNKHNKKPFGRQGRRPNKHEEYLGDTRKPADNKPQVEDKGVAEGINKIAMKDLPRTSYAIKTDPYTEANQAEEPYNMITAYGSSYSPSYKGDDNLDGGYTSQYTTAVRSRLLNVFDAGKLEIGINFRFLHITERHRVDGDNIVVESDEILPLNVPDNMGSRGSQLLRKMYDAITEAMSQLEATTFINMALPHDYSVVSSLLIPDVAHVNVRYTLDGVEYQGYYYTDPAAVMLLMSLEYQTMMQQTSLDLKNVSKLKNNQALMLKMNYERETAPLNSYFGQINKAAFKNMLDSIILTIQGEYIDLDWMRQTNIVTNLNSRQADDMLDPILEICAHYNMMHYIAVFNSKTAAVEADSAVEDLIEGAYAANVIWVGHEYAGSNRTVTTTDGDVETVRSFDAVSRDILALTSTYDNLAWSRDPEHGDGVTRYNTIVNRLRVRNIVATRIKTNFGDLRAIFDKLTGLGIVNYTKGVTFELSDTLNVQPKNYLIVRDMFKTLLSGNMNMNFDVNTGRWTAYALWDKAYGIPLYDAKSGGAFITFCCKILNCNNSQNCEIEYIPELFTCPNIYTDGVHFLNRLGVETAVFANPIEGLAADVNLSRLAILEVFDTLDFKAPSYEEMDDNVNNAWLNRVLLDIFKCYCNNYDYIISEDIIAIYHYQVVSITKSMTTYAKAYGPIKGTRTAEANIGFAGLSGVKSE